MGSRVHEIVDDAAVTSVEVVRTTGRQRAATAPSTRPSPRPGPCRDLFRPWSVLSAPNTASSTACSRRCRCWAFRFFDPKISLTKSSYNLLQGRHGQLGDRETKGHDGTRGRPRKQIKLISNRGPCLPLALRQHGSGTARARRRRPRTKRVRPDVLSLIGCSTPR